MVVVLSFVGLLRPVYSCVERVSSVRARVCVCVCVCMLVTLFLLFLFLYLSMYFSIYPGLSCFAVFSVCLFCVYMFSFFLCRPLPVDFVDALVVAVFVLRVNYILIVLHKFMYSHWVFE